MRQTLRLLILVLLVGTACGGSTESSLPPEGSTSINATEDASDDSPTNEPAADALVGTPLFEGLPQLSLVGPPPTNAGAAPMFEWQSVEAAASYELAVTGPNGPIWAWSGAETAVWLGGLPFERPPGVGGPILESGSCWSVVARDADGHAIAISPLVSVSPDSQEGSC